jgi:hypothetical protein
MKQLLVLSSFFLAALVHKPVQAQVSVQVNIGTQPQWGPAGYDYVDYYYLPDIETYYCVPTRQYIYLEGNRWMFAASLPYRFRNYDLYGGYKVVINGRDPYRNHWEYRRRYEPYCYRQPQIILRDRRQDDRYRRDYYQDDRRRYDDDDRGRGGNEYKHHGHGRGNGHRKHRW